MTVTSSRNFHHKHSTFQVQNYGERFSEDQSVYCNENGNGNGKEIYLNSYIISKDKYTNHILVRNKKHKNNEPVYLTYLPSHAERGKNKILHHSHRIAHLNRNLVFNRAAHLRGIS